MRFAVVPAGSIQTILQGDQPFIMNGVQYPANWLKLSDSFQKEALNIYPVVEATNVIDLRFYWTGNEEFTWNAAAKTVDVTITATPKDVAGLKNTANAQIISTSYSMLAPTDWYVTRWIEANNAIPVNVETFRPAVRERSRTLRTSVAEAATVNDIIVLYTSTTAANGNTYPAPINDWPTLLP